MKSKTIHRSFFAVVLAALVAVSCGCNSLASLGLPFSGPNNRLLPAAARISDEPAVALDLPRELYEHPLDQYPIEIGDIVLVEPVSFDATIRLPGDQVVKPDGTISLGEFGQFAVVHKTIPQLQHEIQELIDAQLLYRDQLAEQSRLALSGYGNNGSKMDPEEETRRAEELRRKREANRINVRLINWDSKRIYVLGEVSSPGSIAYTGNQTVLDALVEAGGMTVGANRHKIIVVRPTPRDSCRIVLKTCYHQIVQLGDTSTNYQLLPGDRVFVPSLTFWEDLQQTCHPQKTGSCPRCAPAARGCNQSNCLPPIVSK